MEGVEKPPRGVRSIGWVCNIHHIGINQRYSKSINIYSGMSLSAQSASIFFEKWSSCIISYLLCLLLQFIQTLSHVFLKEFDLLFPSKELLLQFHNLKIFSNWGETSDRKTKTIRTIWNNPLKVFRVFLVNRFCRFLNIGRMIHSRWFFPARSSYLIL